MSICIELYQIEGTIWVTSFKIKMTDVIFMSMLKYYLIKEISPDQPS